MAEVEEARNAYRMLALGQMTACENTVQLYFKYTGCEAWRWMVLLSIKSGDSLWYDHC
jgi:hypothetical protein